MTLFVFTELFGGLVYQIDDLNAATMTAVGDAALSTPSGPSRDPLGAVAVAAMTGHEIAHADPGAGWTRFGAHGGGVGRFDRPAATAFLTSGQMLVLDAGNCRLVCIDDITGVGWRTYGHRGHPTTGDVAVGAFADPRGMAVDSADRIWVSDPAAKRVIRVDGIDGSGWTQMSLPAGPNLTVPYGICAYQDGILIVDVGNSRLLRIDDDVASVVDVSVGTWIGPSFVSSLGDDIVVADVRANELLLLEPGGDGFAVTATLRGSPPDVPEPLFDSIGGVAS